MASSLLVFELNGCRLGLDADSVMTVSLLPKLSVIPGLPDYVAGIVTIRGEMAAAVDLCKLWDIEHTGDYRCALLLRHDGEGIALLADNVSEIITGFVLPENSYGSDFGKADVSARLSDKTSVLDAGGLLHRILGQS